MCIVTKEQISILKELENYMLTMKFPSSQIHFQNGTIITIRGIIGLQKYLREKLNLPYLLTSRCDQNYQESLHSQLRNDGAGGNRRPTGLALSYRIARSSFISPAPFTSKILQNILLDQDPEPQP